MILIMTVRSQNILLGLISLPLLLIPRPLLRATPNYPALTRQGNTAIASPRGDRSPGSKALNSKSPNPRKCFATSTDVCIFGSRYWGFGLDLDTNYRKTQLLAEIAAKYSQIRQYDRATQIIQPLGNTSVKALALAEIAANSNLAGQARRDEQLFSQVLLVISSLGNYEKAPVLAETAISFTQHGQVDRAEQMFSLALKSIQTLKEGSGKNYNLGAIALKMIEAGQYDRATQFIQLIEDDNQSDSFVIPLWHRIAWMLAESRNVSQILNVAQAIKNESRKAEVLSRTSVRLAENGQFDRAIQIAESIENTDLKTSVLQAVAAVRDDMTILREITPQLGKIEKMSQVLSLIIPINNNSVKASALEKAALKLASQGQVSQAWEVVRAISDELRRDLALSEIVLQLTEAKQFPLALRVVQTLEDIPAEAWEADVAITRIAVKLAQARQFNQALQVSKIIKNDSYKVLALINIAQEYIEAGETDKASELLSQAVERVTPIIK